MDRAPRQLSWPAVAAVLGFLLIGAALYAIRSLTEAPGRAVQATRELLDDARKIASAFRTGTVTTSFTSYASEIRGSTLLQVATLQQLEIFERKDEAALFWGQLALPDVIVEARAPVEYTYHVELKEPWGFTLDGETLLVKAPAIRWNAPAVDVSALRYEIRKGSVLRDEAAVIEKLRLGVSELAKQRAGQHRALVRETARRQAEEFVETWLKARFSDGGRLRARVSFADEPASRRPAG